MLSSFKQYAITTTCLFFWQQIAFAQGGRTQEKFDFMRAMRKGGKIDPSNLDISDAISGSSVRASNRRKEVMAKAQPVPPYHSAQRRAQQSSNYKVRDGTDDYNFYNGDNDNPFSFDVTQYSLQYSRCAEVKQFNDELAAQEDSTTVFTTKHFAVFRFCPAQTCGQEDGCESNYGEYMLEIGDYLEIMKDYHEEHFSYFCEYCEECMYKEYQMWLKNSGGRDLENEDRDLSASYYDDAYEHVACPEYQTCKDYRGVCDNDYNYQDNFDYDYSAYFECTQYTKNNGKTAYVGPHCSDDGEAIVLGLYSDEFCSEYIGRGVDIEQFLGIEMNNETLREYYDPEDDPCIPCRSSSQLYLQYSNNKNNNKNNNNNKYDDDDYSINELCTTLYMDSARCDQHFRSYNKMKYQYYNVDMMKLSCDFIDSVVMGNYDEFGFIKLSTNATKRNNFLQDNAYYQEYERYAHEVTPLQIFGLCASILACVLLGMWSMALHYSLTKAWKPRRGLGMLSPNNASSVVPRTNSGIEMSRSRSAASFYMT